MKIVIPGGSGQVGTILARHCHARGDAVTVLSRSARATPWRKVLWDGRTAGAWQAELEGSDVCINLSGRSVNCRYGSRNRSEILNSRLESTRLLGHALESLARPPRVWMNASTATIYRHALDRPMDEQHGDLGGNETGAPGTWKFSIDVAKGWEHAFFSSGANHVRKVALRSAMTFSPDRGGVFYVLLGLVRRGFGGRQGSGRQYVSWIHERDFVRAIDFLIARDDMDGAVNLAAPYPVTNSQFMTELRRAWGTGWGLAIPTWAVEAGAFFMGTESELILKSRRVVPGRLLEAGFRFEFPQWPAAARELVARWRNS